MTRDRLVQAIANLDAWLESMRQQGGYGGPVVHWWRNTLRYTGPGLDWRYEGILTGYVELYETTSEPRWLNRITAAANDLIAGQVADGAYAGSRFEINPGSLGTPHEAAADLGLLRAVRYLDEPELAIAVVTRNLDNLVASLWDGSGFNDRPGFPSRVPNKLATLVEALFLAVAVMQDDRWLRYAKPAIDTVLAFQAEGGYLDGAIGQGSPGGEQTYFPYYIARCVPALMQARDVFGNDVYLAAARRAVAFLKRTMHPEGAWPQVLYGSRHAAGWPRWRAGTADILTAFLAAGEEPPQVALASLLDEQMDSGAFPTAVGFGSQIRQGSRVPTRDFRDVLPVVGWNDKVLKLLSRLLDREEPASVPEPRTSSVEMRVQVGSKPGTFREDETEIQLSIGEKVVYSWSKCEPWAKTEPPVGLA